jgi:hypothetical protein
MDEITHRNLMQLSATSRVATADASDFTSDTPANAGHGPLPLSEMFELSLEALLNQFRRK